VNDAEIRRSVFDVALTTGRIPAREEIGCSQEDLERLADAHVLVLQETGEILMAMPFSAVPTTFVVRSGDYAAWGNCVWDALGILAMKDVDGVVEAACGCCGTAMPLRVRRRQLLDTGGVVHYGVAAKQWWDDIVFT